VRVGVRVAVWVRVAVDVDVGVIVRVGVGVFVGVRVRVSVGVCVTVDVGVTVGVIVGVAVAVLMEVMPGVLVGACVRVGLAVLFARGTRLWVGAANAVPVAHQSSVSVTITAGDRRADIAVRKSTTLGFVPSVSRIVSGGRQAAIGYRLGLAWVLEHGCVPLQDRHGQRARTCSHVTICCSHPQFSTIHHRRAVPSRGTSRASRRSDGGGPLRHGLCRTGRVALRVWVCSNKGVQA
jgi:hypothetical protein